MNKKIKVMASLLVLMAFAVQDLQSMAGARDFARKLFISKAGAIGSCLAITELVYRSKQKKHDLEFWDQPSLDADIPEITKEEIKNLFKKDGIDITIKRWPGQASNAGVYSFLGSKKFLILSSDFIDTLKEHGTMMGRLKQYLSSFYTTKEEIFAILEHEKSHLKNYDSEKRELFLTTYPLGLLVGLRAAGLCRSGRLRALLTGGLIEAFGATGLVYMALCRYQEKRCDLSTSTSKSAECLATYREKCAAKSEKMSKAKILTVYPEATRPYVDLTYAITRVVDNLCSTHPSHSERAKYLRQHAENLKKQGK